MRIRYLALPFVLTSACATVQPSMTYHSTAAVERIPMKVALQVTVAPWMEPTLMGAGGYGTDLRRGDDEKMAETLAASLAIDLHNNGPFELDDLKPDALLKVHVPRYTTWGSPPVGWLVLNSMLLGVPILFGAVTTASDMTAEAVATLETPSGEKLAEVKAYAECTKWAGLYYNHSVTMECLAQPMMEELRARLAKDKRKILAAWEASRAPKNGLLATVTSPEALGVLGGIGAKVVEQVAEANRPQPRVVIAVFDVEDTSKHLQPNAASQLTEYVAARVTEVLGFRIVPREQLRKQLQAEKSSTYRSCFDESCQLELGKAVAAQKSMATKVIRVGNTCAITSTIYDLKSETTERAATARTECSEDAMLGAVDQVVAQLGAR